MKYFDEQQNMFKHEENNEEEYENDDDKGDEVNIGTDGLDLNKIRPVQDNSRTAVESFENLVLLFKF